MAPLTPWCSIVWFAATGSLSKVLPESFANDPDRLARFQREAKTLAALNHPNIAHIHGLEDSGGVRALVMEFVEGEDLAQRITMGAIPIDEALPIAKQIAEALEAAHESGRGLSIISPMLTLRLVLASPVVTRPRRRVRASADHTAVYVQ